MTPRPATMMPNTLPVARVGKPACPPEGPRRPAGVWAILAQGPAPPDAQTRASGLLAVDADPQAVGRRVVNRRRFGGAKLTTAKSSESIRSHSYPKQRSLSVTSAALG